MSTTMGILGAGRMAVRLARLFANCGHQVALGSRTPDGAARITSGPSGAEEIPSRFQCSRVVGAFQNVRWEVPSRVCVA
jgi:predicted dinucleotide-binding enzyme